MGWDLKKLLLLGIWDEPPLVVWPWFADNSAKHFYKLTGFKMASFTYRKEGLHPQYLLADDTEKLHRFFELLPDNQKTTFVRKICDNYFSLAKKVMPFLKELQKKDFNKAKVKDIIRDIKELCNKLSLVTIQNWFILLLDIWYPQLEEKAELKNIGAKARDHGGYLHDGAKKTLEKMVFQLSKKLKIKKEGIYLLFPDEIGMLIDKKRYARLSKKIILRKKLLVTTSLFGKYSIFEGKKAEELVKEYIPNLGESIKDTGVLKGLPASPGKAKGRARIILLHKQFKDFKKGEILVALQTMVNFVPIMKKSSAIITEFGGITSHAAVVSRELKIPCIVNVKDVTKILKNGDVMEVDADKGIVRRLR